jgi:hypothetical protein
VLWLFMLIYSYALLWKSEREKKKGQLSLSTFGGSWVSFISTLFIRLFWGQMVPLIPKQKHKHKPSPGVGERAWSQTTLPSSFKLSETLTAFSKIKL